MKPQLSILIPTKNYVCVRLVKELVKQATAIQHLIFEIIVADDGSDKKETIEENKEINQLLHCKYMIREVNVGRSAIRNFLALQAQYTHLLFLDSDKYEKDSEKKHGLQQRQASPYRSFCTPNFLIAKEVMLNNPFDETIKAYGYEDVVLGKDLEKNAITIKHIDNPILICEFEENKDYLNKIKTSLITLHSIQDKIGNHSQLVVAMHLIKKLHLTKIVGKAFILGKNTLGNKLVYSNNPSLFLLKLYKIGYFISIQKCP